MCIGHRQPLGSKLSMRKHVTARLKPLPDRSRRWSWSKSNCSMATASAISRSGASTVPICSPLLRMMMGGFPLPSLARPSLLHRLDRKDSKIFMHPLGTRLDVCNGHTRSLSVCHLRWCTNANEPRRICKTLYKSDAAPRLEQHIDVTRRIVGDESLTCRQHRDGWQVCF